jgi:ATP-dependent RNA helicase DDX56/DBP9
LLIRLKVLAGKTFFFVNEIENGFKLELFFESFSISSAVLNAELPLRTRMQTVKDFNNGMIDYLISSTMSFMEYCNCNSGNGLSKVGIEFYKEL